MNKQLESLMGKLAIECPICGAHEISTRTEIEQFQYGEKGSTPILSAEIPVHYCASCDFSFTDEHANIIKHEVVCRHLGVMTPKEIRSIRELYSMSQNELAELSKIGKASLARWETGALIQNQANDNLLFLLTFLDNVTRLRERAQIKQQRLNVVPFKPKFRSLQQTDMERLQQEADRFELFPAAMVG